MLYEKENKGECIYIYECEYTSHENMKKKLFKTENYILLLTLADKKNSRCIKHNIQPMKQCFC